MDNLMKKIINGEWDEFINYLQSGGDVEIRDKNGRTPLMNAVISNRIDIVDLVVKNGANVNSQDSSGFSALHFAAQNNLYEIADFLLKSKAEVDIEDCYGNTPLFRAVFNSRGNGELIELLINYGANKSKQNQHGVSPLSLASTISNFDVKKFLI